MGVLLLSMWHAQHEAVCISVIFHWYRYPFFVLRFFSVFTSRMSSCLITRQFFHNCHLKCFQLLFPLFFFYAPSMINRVGSNEPVFDIEVLLLACLLYVPAIHYTVPAASRNLVSTFFTLRTSCGTVYCNLPCLCVCGWVCGWVCHPPVVLIPQ